MAKIKKFEEIESWIRARRQASLRSDFKGRLQARLWSQRSNKACFSLHTLKYCGRVRARCDQEFLQFLATAKGSRGEVRAQLYVALDQGYLTLDRFETLIKAATEVSQLTAGLMKYLRQSTLRGSKYR